MDILKALRAEESKHLEQLERVRAAIKVLSGKTGAKKKVSAASRAKMAKAQKARWAKLKKAS
jgi:hypothetical protein